MYRAFITGQIRQKAEGIFFSSSHFALRFHQHQNLRYAYPFSHSAGKGISALVFTFIHSLEHQINWHGSRNNCCFLMAFYYYNNRLRAIG